MINQRPYPIAFLPSIVTSAINEIVENVQVTDIMAATSCLTAMSISASPLVDWRHPLSGQTRASVLNQAIVAISGDRKSTTDEIVCGPLYERDIEAVRAAEARSGGYELEMLRWGAVRKAIVGRISKLELAGQSTAEMDARLVRHEAARPQMSRIIYQDTTRFSAFEALEGDGRALAILTDEGQTLLKSAVIEHYGFLNSAWDGKRLLTLDRGNNKHIIVTNPRLTVSFQIQPEVLAEFMHKGGKVVHASGFWARYLFSRSPTRQGSRRPRLAAPMPKVALFQEHVRDLSAHYSQMLQTKAITRCIFEFDEGAKRCWLELTEQVENDFRSGRYLHDISDFGNKYMDIVGRIACLMWCFELRRDQFLNLSGGGPGEPPKIPERILRNAVEVAGWHLDEYKQIFSSQTNPLPEDIDADRLYCYLHRTYFQRGIQWAYKNTVRQCCGIRGPRFDEALRRLIASKALWLSEDVAKANSKTNRKTQFLHFHDGFFQANPR